MNKLFTSGGQSIGVSASKSVLPMNIAVQGTLKSLLQHHTSKASSFQPSAFFIVQLSHLYIITGTIQTFAGKMMSLLFNMLSSESEVAQSCPTLCDPMDCSLPGFSVRGIFQVRILEWVTISFSRGDPDPGIEPRSPALEAGTLTSEPPGKPQYAV